MSTPAGWTPTWAPQSTDNLGPTYITICTILMFAATVTVGMRLTAQRLVSSKFLADDWAIIAGWTLTLVNYIATIICFVSGGGRHLKDIIANDPDPLMTMLTFWRAGYVTINAWGWSSFAIKLSLFFYLRRIFQRSKKTMIALNFTLAFIIVAFFYAFFSYIFSCIPISLFWLQAYADVGQVPPIDGSCPAFLPRGIAAASLTIATDVLLYIIPIIGMWNLQMSRGRKLGIIGVFTLGSFAVVVSVIRLPYIFTESFTDDPPYIEANALLFSIIETTVGIICTCLPCLAPLYRKLKTPKTSYYDYNKGSDFNSSANSRSKGTGTSRNYPSKSINKSNSSNDEYHNLEILNGEPEQQVHNVV